MMCQHEIGPEIQDPPEPAEKCGEDALGSSDYCLAHLPDYDPEAAGAILDALESDLAHDHQETP